MLKLLSSLDVGDTINVSSMSIVSHNSYFTATTRWIYGENRHRTITMIEEEIASTLLQLHKAFNFSQCYDLSEAYLGLKNLSDTYREDKDSSSRLQKCMDAIEKYLKSVGHFNLLEIKKNSKMGLWKRLNTLLYLHPQLAQTKRVKDFIWKIFQTSCIASGKILEPILEDQIKRRTALRFLGPVALKYLLFNFYTKKKFLNLFLKVVMFSISQI
jgi:hypothetical protein